MASVTDGALHATASPLTPSERLYVAVSGGVPDRVPVVPKIWVDLAANPPAPPSSTCSRIRSSPCASSSRYRGSGDSGGYVLGSGCVVPRAASQESLRALRRAAELNGRYQGGRLIDVTDAS